MDGQVFITSVFQWLNVCTESEGGSFWTPSAKEFRCWLVGICYIFSGFFQTWKKVNLGCGRKWERWPLGSPSPPLLLHPPRQLGQSRPSKAQSWSSLRFEHLMNVHLTVHGTFHNPTILECGGRVISHWRKSLAYRGWKQKKLVNSVFESYSAGCD